MVKRALWIGVGLLVGIACNPDQTLTEVLYGKNCRGENHECADGYKCDVPRNVCKLPSELAAGGSSGGSDDAGTPPVDPRDVDPPAGGAGGAAGSVSSAGAGGVSSDDEDAGPLGPDGCAIVPLFRDLDGDGYGSDALEDQKTDCLTVGWATQGGDCLDAEPTGQNKADKVHPGQTDFFVEGYPSTGKPGDVSFDYDCDGQEFAPAGPGSGNYTLAQGECPTTRPCDTTGNGVLPGDRSGDGVNGFCGNSSVRFCTEAGDQCVENFTMAPTPIRCH